MSTNLRLSWAGDHNSLKEFVQNTLELQGNWSSPAGEKKLFEANNIKILWWKNKKFLTIDGDDANRIKRDMMNALLTNSNLDGTKTSVDIATNTEYSLDENHTTKHQCMNCMCTALSPEVEGLKLDFVVLEANLNHKIQVIENQILHYNQNSKYAVSNKCSQKRDDLSSSLEVQPSDNPPENSCVITNTSVNNDMTQNKGNTQRNDSSVTIESQSKNPLNDPYLIANTNANFITTKNINNQKRDESLSVVNTDENEDISAIKSRLKYKNDLLQENVEVLRDENELLRNTMEILTHELEKNRVNTAVCDLSKKNCPEAQSNSQLQSNVPPVPSRTRSAEWINHLNLVHQTTSTSKLACNNNDIHHHDPVQNHNQSQPIPTRITRRKPKRRKIKAKVTSNVIGDKDSRAVIKQRERLKWFHYYY